MIKCIASLMGYILFATMDDLIDDIVFLLEATGLLTCIVFQQHVISKPVMSFGALFSTALT